MPAITPINPTLIDLAKSLDPNGKIAAVAEILNQTNEITRDGVFVEANNVTSHRITQRTGLPPVYWRMLNQGIPPSTSTKAQVDETIGLLTSRVEIDRKEALAREFPDKRAQNGRRDWQHLTDEQRQQIRREKLDRTTPQQRALWDEYMRALKQRHKERGL